MDLGTQLRIHQAGFKAVAAFAPFKQTPIYVTEADPEGCAACPASSDPAYAYRTSPAYGAYEIAMMKHSLELEAQVGVKLGGLLTWAFTFPGTPYFAGYRALATNGINLPVMSAFKLLGRLDGTPAAADQHGRAAAGRHPGERRARAAGRRRDGDAERRRRPGAGLELSRRPGDRRRDAGASGDHLACRVRAARARLAPARRRVARRRVHGLGVARHARHARPPTQVAALQQAMEPAALVPDRDRRRRGGRRRSASISTCRGSASRC